MKKIVFLFFIFTSGFSCKNTQPCAFTLEMPTASTESFDWLLGKWQRVDEREDRQTLETWKKISSSEYRGFGFTMQNSDTIWQEDVKLILRDSIWNFEVTGKGENLPTNFKLIKIESEKFVSENQENDFPKEISYFRNGENLNAIISGGGQEIPFEFIPVED